MVDGFRIHHGAADSPVILHVPHGSRELTAYARKPILLDDDALETELDRMTDAHTGTIAESAAEAARVRPWMFTNELSRLVIDPERFPDEREEMRAVGMGAVYTRTSHREKLRDEDPGHVEELLEKHYRPYAKAMTELVDERIAATGQAIVLDVHSYPRDPLPYELHSTGNRPAICLGVDSFHTPDWLRDAAIRTFSHTDLNTPFSGAYVPLKHYGRTTKVSALMLEIRRDLPDGLDAVVRALTGLVDASYPTENS